MDLANFCWFLSKNIFLPLLKKKLGQKITFLRYLKNMIFSQILTIYIDSSWNPLYKNVYFYKLYFISL